MEGVKAESQDDSSWLEDSQAPGQLGNPLQREQTVPAVLHYKVSSGPPGQTSRDATRLDKGWEEAEGLRGKALTLVWEVGEERPQSGSSCQF